MSHLLTSGQVGNIGNAHFKTIRENVQRKWNDLGFLEGLNGTIQENIAQLYENQATTMLNESTDSASSGSFETVVFPIVRRVFSKLLANDIVSVQAMNMPIGKLFFFVPVTSERDTDGSHRPLSAEHLPAEAWAGGTAPEDKWQETNLYDLYYNDGLFDQSKGKITLNTVDTAANVDAMEFDGNKKLVPAATFKTHQDGTVRNVILEVKGFNSTSAGRLTGPDGNEMDSESFLSSFKVVNGPVAMVDTEGNTVVEAGAEIEFRLVTQKYGRGIVDYGDICTGEGKMYIELDLSAPVANDNLITADGYIGAASFASHDHDSDGGTTAEQTTPIDAAGLLTDAETKIAISYASYDSLELETEMGEVSFKLDEVVVSVQERKLRATWSPELAQDVSAFHNIDAEAELTAMLSEQVASEIDREILKDLRAAAAWTARWDYNGWRKAASASNAYTQKDWNQTLITKINQVSAQIQKSTLRGGANFIIVSTEVSAIFNDLEYFHVSDASAEQDEYNMGIEKIGTLVGRYQVYVDPYSPPASIIIGHKGKSLLDTGYIYAPYVPLQLTPTMYNHQNFAPVKGIMTRYAKKVVNNRFYGAIKCDGIVTFNSQELR
jgi:hypothetical protein